MKSRHTFESHLDLKRLAVFLIVQLSSKVYTDTYMLSAIERYAFDNDLLLRGKSAYLASQILLAMGHHSLLMNTETARRHALLLGDGTPPQCWLAVTNLAEEPSTSRQLSTALFRIGTSKAFVVENVPFLPECE